MQIARYIFHTFLVVVLTVLTQVGGIIYLLNNYLLSFTSIKKLRAAQQILFHFLSFIALYVALSFTLVPLVAKPLGRVPLHVFSTINLRPLNLLTCFLNRHYVRPEMKKAALAVSNSLAAEYPGMRLNYLDANFPFFNGFPLIPHLSHNDGKKLDLAFAYNEYDLKTGAPTNNAPSFIGYGICEEPRNNEPNTADECAAKGYWQYSLLKNIVPQANAQYFTLNEERTARMVELFAAEPSIGKIFIEPHLKQRLHLQSNKIRFHGCRAVRHDDHLHVQVK
jgi:hypothetical protein